MIDKRSLAASLVELERDPESAVSQKLLDEAWRTPKAHVVGVTGPPGAPPASPVVRYVMPDGTLSRTPGGANRVWQSSLKTVLLSGNHLRFLPRTANGIADVFERATD